SANYWRTHVREAVRFNDGMKSLSDEGVEVYLEVGPGTTLIGMGQLCLPSEKLEKSYWLSSLKRDFSEDEKIAESVGALYSHGVKISWEAWEQNYPKRNRVELPTYAFHRKRYWVEGVELGQASRTEKVQAQFPERVGDWLYDVKWSERDFE